MPTATELPSRRAVLGQSLGLASLALAGHAWGSASANVAPPDLNPAGASVAPPLPRVLTAWTADQRHWAGLWQPGKALNGVALPARAHQLMVLPRHARRPGVQALVLARRPGEFMVRMDVMRQAALQWHRMEDDRYLGGHAVLAADGQTFFTTETDASTGQGLVVERDLHSLQARREWASGGIGPHALLLEPGGSLLVANGGILNLPETGRRKLNLSQMDPNLTRLDATSGAIVAQFRLPDPRLSLRHLAVAPNGTTAVALQAEHTTASERATAPAWALLDGQQLRAVHWESAADTPAGWDGYAGDVCYAHQRFWVSAPRAGWLASWSVAGQAPQFQHLTGVGALASRDDHWVAGGAKAVLGQWPRGAGDLGAEVRYPLSTAWDNHAVLLGG